MILQKLDFAMAPPPHPRLRGALQVSIIKSLRYLLTRDVVDGLGLGLA